MELMSNTCNLKWLATSFMLGLVTPASLACLSNTSAESLQHLCIVNQQLGTSEKIRVFVSVVSRTARLYVFLSMRFSPEPLVTPQHVDRLRNLKSLAMDFCDFTSDLCHLLASPRRTPLHRLSLVLNGPALGKKSLDRTPTDNDWKTMVNTLLLLLLLLLYTPTPPSSWSNTEERLGTCVSPNAPPPAQVRVSANLRVYIMTQEVENTDLIRILKPSLPLERLHLDSYNVLVSDAALELVTQQYNKTLTHLHLIRDDPVFPDFTDNRNEDPLVLMAWRCTRLAVLVIHGECLTSALRQEAKPGRRVMLVVHWSKLVPYLCYFCYYYYYYCYRLF